MSSAKIVKDTLFYGLVPKLTIFISVFTLPLITPFLTTYDYGISGVISSYTGFMIAIMPMGLNVHLTNSFFEFPKHYQLVWGRVLFLMLLSSLLLCIINFLILTFTLPMDFSVSLMLLCFLGTVSIIYNVNSILAQHLFPLLQNPKPLVFTNLSGSLMTILLSFVMIYYWHMGYWGLVVPGVISGFIVFLLFVKFIWIDHHIRPLLEHNKRRLTHMFKVGLPLVPHTLGFVFLTNSARVIMSQLDISYNEIGLYSHGCTMGDYAVMVTTALTLAIGPQIQRAYRSYDYTKYRSLYYLCQSVALISSTCICIWLPEIYSFLIKNEELRQSSSIASLMCFSNVVFAFYVFLSTPVFIGKNTIQLLWLVFIPGLLNFLLCLIFIPIYGYKAAIYSTIIAYWSQLLIPYFVSFYRSNVRMWLGDLRKIIFVFVVLLLSLICAQYFSTLMWWIKLLLTLLIIVLFMFFYRHKRMYELI